MQRKTYTEIAVCLASLLAASACAKKSKSDATTATNSTASTSELTPAVAMTVYLQLDSTSSLALADSAGFDAAQPVTIDLSSFPSDPTKPAVPVLSQPATPGADGSLTFNIPAGKLDPNDQVVVAQFTQGDKKLQAPVSVPDLTQAAPSIATSVGTNSDKAANVFLAVRTQIAAAPDAAPPFLSLADLKEITAAYNGAAVADVAANFLKSAKASFDDFVAKGGAPADFVTLTVTKDLKAAAPDTLKASIAACGCAPDSLDAMRRNVDFGASAALAGAPAAAQAAVQTATNPFALMMQNLPDPNSMKNMASAMLATQLSANAALTADQFKQALQTGTAQLFQKIEAGPAAAAAAFMLPPGAPACPFTTITAASQVTAAQNLGFDPLTFMNDSSVQKLLSDVHSGAMPVPAAIGAAGPIIMGLINTQAASLTPEQRGQLTATIMAQFMMNVNGAADPSNKDKTPAELAQGFGGTNVGTAVGNALQDPNLQKLLAQVPSAPGGAMPPPNSANPPAPVTCSGGQVPMPSFNSDGSFKGVTCGTPPSGPTPGGPGGSTPTDAQLQQQCAQTGGTFNASTHQCTPPGGGSGTMTPQQCQSNNQGYNPNTQQCVTPANANQQTCPSVPMYHWDPAANGNAGACVHN